jgi:hypothetical protein
MSFRALVLGAVLIAVSLVAPARGEGPRDVADLFPAQTLAYLEFRQPDRLSREVAALLRGSVLDDMPAVMSKFRDKRGDNGMFFFDDYLIGTFGLFASPEVIAEFGRLQGGAVALTGFTKNMEPEIVGVLLSGTSNAPTFFMRTVLTMDGSMRKVDECEGIALYREKQVNFRAVKVKEDTPPPPAQPYGPTYALLPDGLIIGSTTDSVKEIIRRLKSRTGDPALSNVAAFRDAAKLRDKPGLFGYADLGALNIQLDEAVKNAGPGYALAWNRIKTLLNPKAGRQATLSFTVQNGTVELTARLSLDGNETSPLIDLLPDKTTSTDALHFVPKDAGVAIAVALADGEKRWSKYVALVEAMDKADGKRGQTASKQVAELEKVLNLSLGKDVFGKITEAVLVVDPLVLAAKGNPLRLVVLSTTDADAAKAFEEDLIPKLAALIPPGQAKPKSETIQGQRISSLPFDMLGPGSQLHYGRHGKTLVFGLSGPETATALVAGTKKIGLLGEPRTAAAIKEAGDSSIIGVMPLSSLLPLLLLDESEISRRARFAAPGGAPAPPPKPGVVDPFKVKLTKELAQVTDSLPPATLAIERKPDQVTLVIRQPNLKLASAKIVNRFVDASLEKLLKQGTGGGVEAVPVPKEVPKQ